MSRDYLAWSHDELLRRLLAQDAENERLRAKNDHAVLMSTLARAELAEARLAAVIALCDEETALVGENTARWYGIDKIRAAAKGETK